MSTITDINRPYKKRTGEEMHDALQRFCHAAWYPSEGNHKSCFSIPIDDTDADVILSDAIRELLDLRQRLQENG